MFKSAQSNLTLSDISKVTLPTVQKVTALRRRLKILINQVSSTAAFIQTSRPLLESLTLFIQSQTPTLHAPKAP